LWRDELGFVHDFASFNLRHEPARAISVCLPQRSGYNRPHASDFAAPEAGLKPDRTQKLRLSFERRKKSTEFSLGA